MSGNITVAVRVRPLNARELSQDDHSAVEVKEQQVILQRPQKADQKLGKSEPRVFKFDHAYNSIDHDSIHYADQSKVFTDLGSSLLDGAFKGYNCCIFAYGQTGSGKSYSMMGSKDDLGIIPQICEMLFARIAEIQDSESSTCSVEVSYLEIYSEKVHDLLSPMEQRSLKVREHPAKGPYVEDLYSLVVHNYSEMKMLMDNGNRRRTVASTNMNETSSRSHAVFMIVLKQKSVTAGVQVEKISKISLVDLAGSERAQSTGATGARLKEGAEINKSLSTLGRVISILAEQQSRRRSSLLAKVPYRDSTLTWLLKDSLGGNSLTAMLATISPASSSYEETLSTLRYADSAKRIKNHAVINEDQNMKLIRELREELEALRARMADQVNAGSPLQKALEDQMISITAADGSVIQISKAEIARRMHQSSKMIEDINFSWEEQLVQTKLAQQAREQALEEMGIDTGNGLLGLSSPRKIPHLVNMSEDPQINEYLVYNLKRGRTTCGSAKSGTADIKLSSTSVRSLHCSFVNNGYTVTVEPHEDSQVLINGRGIESVILRPFLLTMMLMNQKTILKTGCRLMIGPDGHHVFRYHHPEDARNNPMQQNSSAGLNLSKESAQYMGLGLSDDLDKYNVMPKVNLADDSTSFQVASRTSIDDSITDSATVSSISTCNESGPEHTIAVNGLRAVSSDLFDLDRVPTVSVPTIDTGSARHVEDLYSVGDAESARRRKRASDTDKLLQEFNASSLLSAVRGPAHSTSLIERLKAVQVNAQKEMQSSRDTGDARSLAMQRSETQEFALVSHVVDKWLSLANIRASRTLLDLGQTLKEAQIMCLQLKQNLNFQFIKKISDSTLISPLEKDDVFDLHGTHSSAHIKCGVSEVMVRIIDFNHCSIHFWSLDRLEGRLRRIKKHNREHKAHMTSRNFPFIERPLPEYSLVGLSSVPVTMIASQMTETVDIDIYSPFTTTQVAVLSIKLKTTLVPNQSACMVELHIVAVKGLSGSDELTDVHVHAYFEADPEMRLTTHVAKDSEQGTLVFSSHYSCLLSLDQLPDVLCFELYGTVQTRLLEKILSWDNLQESYGEASSQTAGLNRLVHNLICETQVLELDTTGSYTPCEVISTGTHDLGVCCLHQGLSRRIVFTLLCSKDDLLKVNEILLAHVRSTAEPIGTTTSEPVRLRIFDISENMSKDSVKLTAQWDSSMHNTKYLDTTTPAEHIISVQISIDLEFRNSGKRALTMRLPLRIQGREEQPGFFSRLFSAARSLPCHITIFPIPFESEEDSVTSKLANLSSARHYQPGQELLQGWTPRGLSLIHNHEIMRKSRADAMDLLKTKMMYTKDQLTVGTPKKLPSRDYVRDIIHYWQTRTRRNRVDDLESRVLSTYAKSATTQTDSIVFSPSIKSGYLSIRHPSASVESRRFFTLRVPYLLQYTSAALSKLEIVVDLSRAIVEDSGSTTFTVKSAGLEVVYIAPSETAQLEWTSLILRI